ncbi:hypothetical protein JB92DRAFT_3150331 [Gautieria morchelliformis]|nr:hypothetical protein JB92DRAFT_3150331 [Gautieria morchelliformis]
MQTHRLTIISFITSFTMPSIRSSSNSIPLQSLDSPTSNTASQWSLDSEDIRSHAELHNIVHPQMPPAAQLSTKHPHPYFPTSFAMGDSVFFQDSPEPFIFLGYTGKVSYDDEGKEEYNAEFRAPYPTSPPASILLNLHQKASGDHIRLSPPCILSWEWIKEKLRSYFCW